MKALISILTGSLLLSACTSGSGVFVPRSDYGIAPQPSRYTQPGDCQGGSQLAALRIPEPEYPRAAYNRGQQGWVVLRLNVDERGRPKRVRIVDAQPNGIFNAKARTTVQKWRFEPPRGGMLENCIVVLDYRLGRASIGL